MAPDDPNDFPSDKTIELSASAVLKAPKALRKTKRPCLIVLGGPSVGRLYEIDKGEMIIGRSTDSDVSLEDSSISRHHARLERQGDRIVLMDMGSTNGIFVNAEKVSSCSLRDGDHLRIGQSTILKFSYQDEVEEEFRKKMYDSAVRDSLTEVLNKRFFVDSLKSDFAHAARCNSPLSLLMIDIDFFKKVNDTHGHVTGDVVLKNVARLIGAGLRSEDVLCRYGGEEFAVILRRTGTESAPNLVGN